MQPGNTTPTGWYQQTIGQLLDYLNPSHNQAQPWQQAQTPPAQPLDSLISHDRQFSEPSTSQDQGQDYDPGLDADGYPTSDEWFQSQGYSYADMNRELVQLQEFFQMIADPNMRAQALSMFDQAAGGGAPQDYQQDYQRPQFPGYYQEGGIDPQQALDNAIAMGNQPGSREAWGAVPPGYTISALLNSLPNV